MRRLVIGTAGHIDHGKSALVKALTGTDPDRLKEEQERGITIDLGFAHTVIGDLQVAFVDVPGHERFVRNMLAGAGGIDAVVLVIAADESVMPQTREHFEICRLLDIDQGIVAITKSDLVDSTTLELAALEARDLVAGSFLAGARIVPVSAKTGAGLDEFRRALTALAADRPRRARPGLARLPVDRAFTVKGFGTVVTGTLVSGEVNEDAPLVVLPADRSIRIRGIQVHGQTTAHAAAPARVALNLGGVDVADVPRGVTLATPGALAITKRVDVRLTLIAGTRPVRQGARVRIHHGTAELVGRIALAATRAPESEWHAVTDAGGAVIPSHGEAYARVRLDRPAAITRGDRLVLRALSPASTLGGAIVLDPEAPPAGLRRSSAFVRFQQIDITDSASAAEFVRVMLSEAGVRGLSIGDLIRRAGLDPASAPRIVNQIATAEHGMVAGDRLFDAKVAEGCKVRVMEALAQFHDVHPREPDMPREQLRDAVARGGAQELFDIVVAELTTGGVIRGTDRLVLASHNVGSSSGDVKIQELVERTLRDAGLAPPDLAGLAAAIGINPVELEALLRRLVREDRVTRIGDLLFHTETLDRLRADLRALKAAANGNMADVSVGAFKERYGLSRKFAIPLLEWLDRQRVTRRLGERRVVL